MASSFIQAKTYTKVNGTIARLKAMVNSDMPMVVDMRVNGTMICSMVMVVKSGLMAQVTMVSMRREGRRAKAHIFLQMDLPTVVAGKTIWWRELGHSSGKTAEDIMALGSRTWCMAMEDLSIRTNPSTKEVSCTTWNMEMVFSQNRTAQNGLATGRLVSRMARVSSNLPKVVTVLEYGRWARWSSGLRRMTCNLPWTRSEHR